jgi:hypothetical protein
MEEIYVSKDLNTCVAMLLVWTHKEDGRLSIRVIPDSEITSLTSSRHSLYPIRLFHVYSPRHYIFYINIRYASSLLFRKTYTSGNTAQLQVNRIKISAHLFTAVSKILIDSSAYYVCTEGKAKQKIKNKGDKNAVSCPELYRQPRLHRDSPQPH